MLSPKKLAQILRVKGISQAELARRLSIHPSSVSRLVNGKRTAPKHLVPAIAKALEVDEAELHNNPKDGTSR